MEPNFELISDVANAEILTKIKANPASFKVFSEMFSERVFTPCMQILCPLWQVVQISTLHGGGLRDAIVNFQSSVPYEEEKKALDVAITAMLAATDKLSFLIKGGTNGDIAKDTVVTYGEVRALIGSSPIRSFPLEFRYSSVEETSTEEDVEGFFKDVFLQILSIGYSQLPDLGYAFFISPSFFDAFEVLIETVKVCEEKLLPFKNVKDEMKYAYEALGTLQGPTMDEAKKYVDSYRKKAEVSSIGKETLSLFLKKIS